MKRSAYPLSRFDRATVSTSSVTHVSARGTKEFVANHFQELTIMIIVLGRVCNNNTIAITPSLQGIIAYIRVPPQIRRNVDN